MNGEDFDLDVVTDTLGIKPTRARKKSEFPQPSIDSGIAGTHWSYKVREEYCDDISIPFDKILNVFNGKASIINKLCKDMNLYTFFSVIIHVKTGNRPLNDISKEALSFVASINATIGFDLYCYDEDNYLKLEAIER